MAVCMIIVCMPPISTSAVNGYSDADSFVATAVVNRGDASSGSAGGGGSVITGWKLMVTVKFYCQPAGGGQPYGPTTEYLGGEFGSELAAKASAQTVITGYLSALQMIEGKDGRWFIGGDSTINITAITSSRSEGTRHYGLEVFHGKVTAPITGGQLTEGSVVSALTSGKQSQTSLGVTKIGGKNDDMPMNGVGGIADSLAPTIQNWTSNVPADFFNAFGSYIGMTLEQFNQSQTIASGNISVPYVAVTLAMSSGSNGGVASLIRGHINPWNTTAEAANNFFNSRASGGGSLISGILAGNSTLKLSTSQPVYSKYVFPIGITPVEIDSAFVFGVESSPKDNNTKWEDPDSTRQGSFKVNVRAAVPTNVDPNTIYTIKVTATKVDAMYDGPFLGTVTQETIEEKQVKGADLAKEKPVFIKFGVTGGGPGDPSPKVLNKGVLKINVQVTAPNMDPKDASYLQELSDEVAVGSGYDGYNYVGWKTDKEDIIERELDLVPWAQHSAADPLINGTLGASEYNNEDWETGTGIPSTENVYVLAGGETAVSDLAGYFVIHASDGKGQYTEVSTDMQGENEEGVGGGNPAVTREILLTASVQNSWGWNNTLCHRQAAEFNISGGESSYTGGGNGWSCNGGTQHSGAHGTSGMHCAGNHTLGNQTDAVAYGPCKIHGTAWTAGSGTKSYSCSHNSCGACTGDTTNEDGSKSCNSCGGASPNSDSPETVDHDCSWSLSVFDGDRNDSVNVGVKSEAAIELPESFTITVSGWQPLTMSAFNVTSYTPGSKGDKGQEFWKNAVISCSKGHESNAEVTGTMTWTKQANQYFHVSGSFQVRQLAKAIGPHASGCGHWDSKWQNVSTGAGTTEEATLSPSNPTGELCNGYSYGTGSRCDEFENCYHMKEHNYVLKYLERIDFYTFRTVTDAHLAAMRGSEIGGVNQVERSGYEEMNGTFSAPIAESAVGESATAPESIGYLWRCLNEDYGSYVNGEGLSTANGEYNGRILFEIWKEPEAGAGGALSYEFNTNFCLGNAEIKAVLLQDNEFGNEQSVKDQYRPTEALDSLPPSIPNRGDSDDRYNHGYVTSEEKGKGKGSNYAGGEGDCLNKDWVADRDWEAKDDTQISEYREIIIAEQNAIVNFWQGKNKDDNYHATIISDNMCYGGNTNTTSVIGEYYSVDEGIPLFNYLGGRKVRTEIDDEEGPIYRNHHSEVGSTKDELADFILNYNCPAAPSMNEGDHYGFFGFGGVADGGDTPLADTLTGKCVEGTIHEIENGNKGSWVPGADVIDAYRRKLGAQAAYPSTETMSGITEFQSYLPNAPTPGGDSFSGYWNDHNYPAHVNETICGRVNNASGQELSWEELADFQFDGTNSGTLNQQNYGQSLLMHNLMLVDWTPNGVWPTVEINNAYGWLLDINSDFDNVHSKLSENGVYDAHKNIVSTGLGMQLPETIRIYDPISVENSHNIGNQYGAWSGDSVNTPDDSDKDQRITSIDKDKNDFAAIGNYVNTNTYLWTWIAPFGDFSSVGGTGDKGAESMMSADVIRNQGNKGYIDEMYIGTWTKEVKIHYPFIGKAKGNNKVSEEFFIRELDSVYGSGNSEYMEAAVAPDILNNFYTSIENPEFKFGNAVGCLNTVNLTEGKDLPVTITAYAINDGIQSSDNSCSYGSSVNGDGNNSDKWCNAASIDKPIDLVGQIGNLAIHDTTDFRFSTYFKQPIEDSWLIDGIVLNTNEKEPVHILAQPKDILFQDAQDLKYGHSTLGITNMSLLTIMNGKGMGGQFGLLPLTPAYITVPEFKTDALRLGYKVFASIETIGNYEATHKPGVKYPTNYDQAQDPSMDTRDEYMEIISEYYLYDFDTGKFYAVDLWSGPEGAKQCIYSGSDRKVRPQLNSEPLYINMDEEFYRRNVSNLEDTVSKFNHVIYTSGMDNNVWTAVMSGLEFIGYTGHLKLDTMDLTYCGSDAVQGIEGYNTSLDNLFTEYSDNSQRWHFTSGLTSTTTPTMPIYSDGSKLTATQVENAYKDLKAKHPNSVIIEFQNYIAKGSVWTLKYKGSLMNTDMIRFYSDPEDCPYDEKSHIETEYKDYTVYNPDTDAPYGSQTIDKDSTPLVVYEAYKSNSEDRTVAGTH